MAKINLDALIQREDFEIEDSINNGVKKTTISISDLVPESFFYSYLRKPDFQRETNEWDGKKISEFLESFLDGDLIPAIILWKAPSGYIFVIDGSHRLSALLAWINDDFGDGLISKRFYDGIIPDDQLSTAEKTKTLIRKRLGTYQDFKLAQSSPEKVDPKIIARAKNLSSLAIQLQWVEGDAHKAEGSFFKINRQAAPINPTELTLLESRKKPNCIAARAIIRSGKGHKYWSSFSQENIALVESLSKEINSILFEPPLKTPLKTLDIPIGGKLFSAQTLPLILDFVNIVNKVDPDFKNSLQDDEDGSQTIIFLEKAKKVANLINSLQPSSLGLHPIVYFYSLDGRYKIASFYATVVFVMELEQKKLFPHFISSRSEFEDFLMKYDYIIQQIVRKYRSAIGSFNYIKEFYFDFIQELKVGKKIDDAINTLLNIEKYKYLTMQNALPEIESADFSSERKSAVYVKEALKSAPKCKICHGYIHSHSVTIDHIKRKREGGLGTVENGQIAHPYCNSTIKN